MAGSHYPYTLREDKIILRYIIDGQYGAVIKGNSVWKLMDDENVCPGRSWQSLKNRFKRQIMKDISRPEFGLTYDEKRLLKSNWDQPPPTSKRQIDHRLITRKLQQQVRSDAVLKEKQSSSSEEFEEDKPKQVISALQASAKQTEKRTTSMPKNKKQFYKLGVEWSDSDSD